MRFAATRLIVAATIVCATVMAAIYAGALDFLAHDANVATARALWSIATYWASFVLVVLVVAGFVRRPGEMVLAVASLVLLLCALEVAVRAFDVDRALPPYAGLSSSAYHHVNAPNAKMFMGVYDGHPVVIRTNEDGLRCDLSREEFVEHKERVVVMGDSFVWGMGVRQDSMLTEVMQRTFRERLHTDDVAVLSASAISYSPFLLKALYRGVFRRYRPTSVVLVLDASDIGDDLQYARENLGSPDTLRFDLEDETPRRYYVAIHGMLEPLLGWVGDNLMYPYNTFFRPGVASYDYYDFELRVGGAVEKNRFFIYRHPLDETRQYFDHTLSLVNDIARDARSDGASFTLVVSPRYNHWSDRECPGNWEVRQYKYTLDDPYEFEYIRYFREAAPGLDYDVVDLLPYFEKTDEFPLVFATDPHWNEAGHRFVAGILSDDLISRGLVR